MAIKKKKKKCWNAASCIQVPSAGFVLKTNSTACYHLRAPPPRGKQSGSVPLDLFDVQLASQLIHVLPYAAEPRPQRLPIGQVQAGVPLRLLVRRSGRRHALFGPRKNVLCGMWSDGAAAPPAGEEALVRLAAIFTGCTQAAQAVEIP